MYTEVRKALSELASFEDLVQSGRVVDGALAVLGGHLAPHFRFVVAPGRQDGVDLGQVRRVVALVEGH